MITKQRTNKTNKYGRGLGVVFRDIRSIQSKRSVSKI